MVTEVIGQVATSPSVEVVEQPAPVVEEVLLVESAPIVAETVAPVAPIQPVITPAIAPEVQQYIARLEQQNQVAQEETNARVLGTVVGQRAQQVAQKNAAVLAGLGVEVTPEQLLPFAQEIAQREGDLLYQQYQASQGEHFLPGQLQAALAISKDTGADPQVLWHLPSPEAMIAAAKQATAQNTQAAEVAALKAELAALKKGSVPAQTFASGAVSGDGARVTADNIDAMYLKDPSRYGEAYRLFLRTGQI